LLSSTKFHILIYNHTLLGNFHNKAHHDNDGSLTTFGIWALVDKQGNWISESRNSQEIPMTGELFYIFPYKIKIDFAAMPYAIWELIWCGKENRHATVDGKMAENLDWFGTAAQTSKKLLERIVRGSPLAAVMIHV
jgi:hypothetical protein